MFTTRTMFGIKKEIIFGDQNHFLCQAVNLFISAVKLGILMCLSGLTRFWRQPQGSIRVAVFQPRRLLAFILCNLDGLPIVRNIWIQIGNPIHSQNVSEQIKMSSCHWYLHSLCSKYKKLLSILLPMESWNYELVQHKEVMHLAMLGRNKQALLWVKEEATNVFRAAFQT